MGGSNPGSLDPGRPPATGGTVTLPFTHSDAKAERGQVTCLQAHSGPTLASADGFQMFKKASVTCKRRLLLLARKGLWGREEVRLRYFLCGRLCCDSLLSGGRDPQGLGSRQRVSSGHSGPQTGWRTYIGQVGPSSGQSVGHGRSTGSARRGSFQKRNPLLVGLLGPAHLHVLPGD